MQASDWPFMIAREQSPQYAVERVKTHLARFEQACRGHDLEELADIDDPIGAGVPAAIAPPRG